ncbi:EamA family transporter [Actinomyces ruminicola]|uniref:EamA family transporter n=1 Tax=Actinomyces ruminicola TaxID=332524 RepID=UPI0011CA1B55|nr:EamA family transporter [Actinomyces ruminicola]
MWILLACGSALFAGLTAILAKLGVRTTDSTLATALRTPVILLGAWAMTLLSGSIHSLGEVTAAGLAWLVLSGLATGASWLCYFRALQLGGVSRVVPVDKLSTVITVVLAVLLLGESVRALGWIGLLLITAGTALMLDPADMRALPTSIATGLRLGGWLPYAFGSAFFAALTAILGKLGVADMPSDLATAIRTVVVLVMAWGMVGISSRGGACPPIVRSELAWVLASGLATCASWLCYFGALAAGPASVVVPIDKLSVVVAVGFSMLVLREQLGRRYLGGLLLLVVGTLVMTVA